LRACFPVRHLCARRGAPRCGVRIEVEANRELLVPEVTDNLAMLATEACGTTPEELTTVLNDEMEQIRLLAKLGALRPE
jgi:hypothetical protein